MCLYPRLMFNPKYKTSKKNGGIVPAIPDKRVMYVPIGCNVCIECRKQKQRNWQARLGEDVKINKNGKFVTLTFNTESLVELNKIESINKLKGYDKDNGICILAIRRFLERWRKKYGKSLRHWFVSELGHKGTEHVHMHGIVWCDDLNELEKIWQYGWVWKGNEINGKLENYVNERTVNYIVKYISKVDSLHLNYKSIVLTSSGIGRSYTESNNSKGNKYKKGNTNESYRTGTGHKINMPIYWRNKIYSDEEREKLWLEKLDKNERYVCGERIRIRSKEEEEEYYRLVKYHRERTETLGYRSPEFIWSKKEYEEQRRKIMHEKRLNT